jgi:hypothetical protein
MKSFVQRLALHIDGDQYANLSRIQVGTESAIMNLRSDPMDQAERAFWIGVWRGILAGLSFLIVVLCYVHSIDVALQAGAYIALIYAVGMWMDAPYWPKIAQLPILRFAQSGTVLAIMLCVWSRLI